MSAIYGQLLTFDISRISFMFSGKVCRFDDRKLYTLQQSYSYDLRCSEGVTIYYDCGMIRSQLVSTIGTFKPTLTTADLSSSIEIVR